MFKGNETFRYFNVLFFPLLCVLLKPSTMNLSPRSCVVCFELAHFDRVDGTMHAPGEPDGLRHHLGFSAVRAHHPGEGSQPAHVSKQSHRRNDPVRALDSALQPGTISHSPRCVAEQTQCAQMVLSLHRRVSDQRCLAWLGCHERATAYEEPSDACSETSIEQRTLSVPNSADSQYPVRFKQWWQSGGRAYGIQTRTSSGTNVTFPRSGSASACHILVATKIDLPGKSGCATVEHIASPVFDDVVGGVS